MKFRLNNEKATINICRSMKQSCDIQVVSSISYRFGSIYEVKIKEQAGVEALAVVIINFESDGIEDYKFKGLHLNEINTCKNQRNLSYMKHSKSPPPKPSIEGALNLELKVLPPHLRYVFLGRDDTLPVIIVADLNGQQVECLVEIMKSFKRAIV